MAAQRVVSKASVARRVIPRAAQLVCREEDTGHKRVVRRGCEGTVQPNAYTPARPLCGFSTADGYEFLAKRMQCRLDGAERPVMKCRRCSSSSTGVYKIVPTGTGAHLGER